MYNKTIIIRFGFCDIQNNRGLGKGYQPQLSALANNPNTSTWIILDMTKTSSNNCLKHVHYLMLMSNDFFVSGRFPDLYIGSQKIQHCIEIQDSSITGKSWHTPYAEMAAN